MIRAHRCDDDECELRRKGGLRRPEVGFTATEERTVTPSSVGNGAYTEYVDQRASHRPCRMRGLHVA